MTSLDLKRDLAFFLNGLADPSNPDDTAKLEAAVKSLMDVVKSRPTDTTFESFEEFSAAVKMDIPDYFFTPAILTRAEGFFSKVEAVYEQGDKVLYDMKTCPHGAACQLHGADLLVDYFVSPENLYQKFLDGSVTLYDVSGEDALFSVQKTRLNESFPQTERAQFAEFILKRDSVENLDLNLDLLSEIMTEQAITTQDFVEVVFYFDSIDYKKYNPKLKKTETKNHRLTIDEVLEAVNTYYSEDFAWMDPLERREIILNSFNPAIVHEKKKKFDRYYDSTAFERHREIAQEHLDALKNFVDENLETSRVDAEDTGGALDTGSSEASHSTLTKKQKRELQELKKVLDLMSPEAIEELLDNISLTILVESAGTGVIVKELKNDSYYGLMQVSGTNFLTYAPQSFNGSNHLNEQVNIATGVNYLLRYCFGPERNTDQTYSRALANYNCGADNAYRYLSAAGADLVKNPTVDKSIDQTRDYQRDYLIYWRFIEARERD